MLLPNPQSNLPGGEQVSLREQLRYISRGEEHHEWSLYFRGEWLDDQWAEVWWQVAKWLAPFVSESGYGGFFREEANHLPSVLTFRAGVAYLNEPGAEPRSL